MREELGRYLINDFLIGYCQRINKRDFTVMTEALNRRRTGKRVVLDKSEVRAPHTHSHYVTCFLIQLSVCVIAPSLLVGEVKKESSSECIQPPHTTSVLESRAFLSSSYACLIATLESCLLWAINTGLGEIRFIHSTGLRFSAATKFFNQPFSSSYILNPHRCIQFPYKLR